jgi:hypothetical protein
MRKAGSFILVSLVVAACGVGNDMPGGGDDDPLPIDPNPNGIACSDTFVITGTFTEGVPARPIDPETQMPVGGCWPVGTWTWTAALEMTMEVPDITGDGVGDRCGSVAGTSRPTVNSNYAFQVMRVDDGEGFVESYEWTGDRTNYWKVKVSEGGGGDCEGAAEFISPDKTGYWNMKPNQAGNVLSGFGEYILYLEPQPY